MRWTWHTSPGSAPLTCSKMRLPDIRDGFLWLTQGKTRKLIERIQGRAYKVTSLALIRNETGQPLFIRRSTTGLRKRANGPPKR